MMIVLPPVETNLLRLVDGTDQQPDPNREKLNLRERNLDIPRNDESLVENAIEDVDQAGRAPVPLSQWRRHRFGILRDSEGPGASTAACCEDRALAAMAVPQKSWEAGGGAVRDILRPVPFHNEESW